MWSVKQHNKHLGSKLVAQLLLNLSTTTNNISKLPTTNKSQQIILYCNIPINGYIYLVS